MSETAMSPHEAVRALTEASRYEDALQRRTEGLTWMVWALATPAIFLSYAFASFIDPPAWVQGVLWMPWVFGAILTTVALWRSVAIAFPRLHTEFEGWFWLRFLAFTAVMTGLFYVVEGNGATMPLLIVGAMWIGMGVLDLWSNTPAGRVAAVAAGLPLVIAGVALWLLDAPRDVSGIVGLLVSGGAPLVVGGWLAFRG